MNSRRSTIPQDVPIFLPNILPTGEEEPIVYNLQSNDFVVSRIARAAHEGHASVLFTSLTNGVLKLQDQTIKFKVAREARKFCEGPRSVCFSRRGTGFRKVGVTEGEIILENPMDTEVSPAFRQRIRAQAEAKSRNSIFIDDRLTLMRDPSTRRRRGGRSTPQSNPTNSFSHGPSSQVPNAGGSSSHGRLQSPTTATPKANVTTNRAQSYTPGQSSTARNTPTPLSTPASDRGLPRGLRSKPNPFTAFRRRTGTSTGLRSAPRPSTGERSDLLPSTGLRSAPVPLPAQQNNPATPVERRDEAGSSTRPKRNLLQGLKNKLTSLTGFDGPIASARNKLAHTFHHSKGQSSKTPRSPTGDDNVETPSGRKRDRDNHEESRKKPRLGPFFSKDRSKSNQSTQNSGERTKRPRENSPEDRGSKRAKGDRKTPESQIQPKASGSSSIRYHRQGRRSSFQPADDDLDEIQPNVPGTSSSHRRKRQRDDDEDEIQPNPQPQRPSSGQKKKAKTVETPTSQRVRVKITKTGAGDSKEPQSKRTNVSERVKTPYKQSAESSSSSESEDDPSYDYDDESDGESEEEAEPSPKRKTGKRSSFGKKGLLKLSSPSTNKDRGQSSKVTGQSSRAGAASSAKKKTPQKQSNKKQVSRRTSAKKTPASSSSRGRSRRDEVIDVDEEEEYSTPERDTQEVTKKRPSATKASKAQGSNSKTPTRGKNARKNKTQSRQDAGSASRVTKECKREDELVEETATAQQGTSSSSDPDAEAMAASLMNADDDVENESTRNPTTVERADQPSTNRRGGSAKKRTPQKAISKADGKRTASKSKQSEEDSDDEYDDEDSSENTNEDSDEPRPTTGGKGLVPYASITNFQNNGQTDEAQPEANQNSSSSSESESAESSSSESGDNENESSSSDHNSYNSDQYSSSSTLELEERQNAGQS